MRTYDPADGILYVHPGQQPAAPTLRARADDECHRLPSGYANAFPGTRLPGPDAARPALVLLPGGSADTPTPTPALRLAQ